MQLQTFSARAVAFVLGFALLLFLTPLVFADVNGTVRGTATDPSGAVVANVSVTLSNPHSGYSRTVQTSPDGAYEFLAVPPGEDYRIDASAPGFQKTSKAGIRLLINQVYVGDFQLKVGSEDQSVSVTASEMQIESTSSQLGDVIGSQKMTDLPLNGRNFTDLMGLQPGVVPGNSPGSSFALNFFNVTPAGTANGGQISVNGGRETANQFVVNGSDVEESFSNGTTVEPNLDSIQEFRILTNTFDAEYGRFSGAIVNVITKSGSNNYHGTAFEFLRNNAFDAHDYTDPVGTPKRDFKRNQFGGTFGGPIIKNRLFFFTDYQGWREARGNKQITDVPSDLEYSGDFSQASAYTGTDLVGTVFGNPTPVPGATGMDQLLTQRLGYTVVSGEPYWTPGCNTLADSQAGMCVFYGQKIPQAAWSPAATAILQKGYFQHANGTDPTNGYPAWISNSYPNRLRDDKFGEKVDLSTHSWGQWGLYYFYDKTTYINPFASATVPGFPANTPNSVQNISIRHTYNIGSSTVNEASIAFNRFATPGTKPVGGLGKFSDFGFVEGGLGLVPTVPAYEGLPRIGLGRGESIGATDANVQADNNYMVADNLSKIIGKHTIKVGGQFRLFQVFWRLDQQFDGVFTFGSGSETKNDFANFLIGAPSNFSQASPTKEDSISKYAGFYGQDSYQLRPNLTLNYGLRWEVDTPWADKLGRVQTFQFTPQPVQSRVYPDAPAGFLFPGDPGIPKGVSQTKYNKFAPRFGFAYSPSHSEGFLGKLFGGPGKTSIRGGAGLYYNAFEQVVNYWLMGNPPFGLYYSTLSPIYLEAPYAARSGPNPGQRFPVSYPPPGTTGIWDHYQPVCCITGWDPKNTLPYSEQFNFSVQRQIGGSSILNLAYVGTRGHHLITQRDVNPSSSAKCMAIDSAGAGTGTSCSGLLYGSDGVVTGPNPNGGHGPDFIYDLGGGNVYNGLRTYSVTTGRLLNSTGQLDFAEVGHTSTAADSNYNALQASIQTRFKSLQLLGSYTWSRSFDNSSGFLDGAATFLFTWQNPINPSISKGLSSFDVTHNFVLSYNYELPFAHLLPSQNGIGRKILGGWELSGITRFASGFPVFMHTGDVGYDPSLCFCAYTDAPDYNGASIPRTNPRKYFPGFGTGYYLDPTVVSPFSVPNLLSFGNSHHRFFSGPGINQWDMALHKVTTIHEQMALEFRAEFFNLMNHVQFSGVDGGISNPIPAFGAVNPNFGKIQGERDMRIGQLALKLTF